MTTEKRKLKVQKKSVHEKMIDSDNSSTGPGEPKNKTSKEGMDYNAPKPGPHAKVRFFK